MKGQGSILNKPNDLSMQGKKYYQPKLFTTVQLSDKIPENNFYRRLKETIDLEFLRKETQPYYGKCGQKSLDLWYSLK